MATKEELIPLTGIQPIRGWEEFLHDGDAYHKTATAAYKKKTKFLLRRFCII